MRTRFLPVLLVCLSSGCGKQDSVPPPPSGPSGEVLVDSPTSSGTYTVYRDTVELSGTRRAWVSSVTWKNTSTGEVGAGKVINSIQQCWSLGYVYECTVYLWSASVPLQLGDNPIEINGDGVLADSIAVTRAPSFGLSGTVAFNGAGQFNIMLALRDPAGVSSPQFSYSDGSGSYRFSYVPAGTYTLAPSDPCYTFSPASRSVTGSGADISGMDFALDAKPGATVSGRLTWATNGSGIGGVPVSRSHAGIAVNATTVVSRFDGYFTFTCVPDGFYVITPDLSGLVGPSSFTPPNRSVAVVNATDVTGQDFQGAF